MLSARFDPSSFFRVTEHVALHVPAGELFSLLTRTFDVPAAWAALVNRKNGAHAVLPPGGTVDGGDALSILFVRATPIHFAQPVSDLLSADRFSCNADVQVAVAIHPDRSELVSFSRAILGSRRVARIETLADYLRSGIASALASFVARHDAASLVDGTQSDGAAAELHTALAGPCFTAGLILDAAPRVLFTSPALMHARRAESEAARQRAEQTATRERQTARRQAHVEHVQHVADLLDRLRAISAATPDVPFPDLIRTFSEQQRGDIYQALFAAQDDTAHTRWLVAATAEEVLFFDPKDSDQPARRIRLAGPPGPARSVQSAAVDGETVLFVGAARGVYRIPDGAAAPDLILTIPDAPAVRGGFNAVAIVHDQVFASHSELGICAWYARTAATPRRWFPAITAAAKAVREIRAHHGDLYCGVDDRVLAWNAEAPTEHPPRVYAGSAVTLTALTPATSGLYAGTSAGEVLHWSHGESANPRCLHRGPGRPVESLHLLAAQGVERLIFTDTSPHVYARVLGDNFLCRFEAGGQTIRRVEAADDLLLGLSDTRDRLFLWTTGKPDQLPQIIPVHRLVGQSVQDICLI